MKNKLEQALLDALDDEYKAQATYRQIIEKFGEIRPFINIVEAEGRHALLPLFEKYAVDVPDSTWPQRVIAPDDILQACKVGVEAGIENADLYQTLLANTQDYPDVQEVFKRLQRASQESHLPAFQRCVERGGGGGGKGRGREANRQGPHGTR